MPPVLYLIALGNLVVGSSAFVVSGLVDLIARDLNTSVAAAGQAMSVYALATALLAPPMLVATARWPRRRALLLGLGLVTVGNVVCALAAGLWPLYAGRLVLGLGSMFTPVGAALALALVAPAERGRALSLAFLGMSLSYVVGVPLGSAVGRSLGWAAAPWLMAGAAALTMALVAWRAPRDVQAPAAPLAGLLAVLRRADVLAVLGMTLLYFSAIFIVFSYIAPVLFALVPSSRLGLSWTLTVFGLAGVAGTLLGGWANDRFGARRSLVVLLAMMVSSMALLPLARPHEASVVALLVLWGTAGFGMMAPQQARLAQASPAQAPLLLSLNASMLYLGTALGAAVGGPASARWGFDVLPWVAAPFAVAAWLLLVLGPRPRPAALATAATGPT